MSNLNPIGVLDSGIGGLSVLSEIHSQLPAEHLVYIADQAYVPYGNKSQSEIRQRVELICKHLNNQHQVKAIVIACNTATAAAVSYLREQMSIPVIGMEPGIKPAVERSRTGVVGILATKNTLNSEKFSHLVNRHGQQAQVITQQCHGLVERIEQGDFSGLKTRRLVQKYLAPLLDNGVDTIVLGCTHYPFVTPLIEEIAGPEIMVIETGKAIARQLGCRLTELDLLNPSAGSGTLNFFSTQAHRRSASIGQFWPQDLDFDFLQFASS